MEKTEGMLVEELKQQILKGLLDKCNDVDSVHACTCVVPWHCWSCAPPGSRSAQPHRHPALPLKTRAHCGTHKEARERQRTEIDKIKHHTYAVSDITTSQMIISLETITNIIDKHREAHNRAIHLSVLPFVFSDLPQSFLVVGGPAGAQQLELPQGWGLVCGTEDRRTGWPRQNLRLTVPPENSHTVHHAPPSFLRSGRFSALRRSTNIIVLVSLKTIKETSFPKEGFPLRYSSILLSFPELNSGN